jgi:hypothetical protein
MSDRMFFDQLFASATASDDIVDNGTKPQARNYRKKRTRRISKMAYVISFLKYLIVRPSTKSTHILRALHHCLDRAAFLSGLLSRLYLVLLSWLEKQKYHFVQQ